MTGMDLLKEELAKRGFKKQQIESKIVAATVDILANTGTLHFDIANLEYQRMHAIYVSNTMQLQIKILDAEIEEKKKILKKTISEIRDQKTNERKYIEAFNFSMRNCETAEGRDAMRRAQMLVNSIDPNSKAYAWGLASILSGANFGEGLEKISPVKPQEDDGWEPINSEDWEHIIRV